MTKKMIIILAAITVVLATLTFSIGISNQTTVYCVSGTQRLIQTVEITNGATDGVANLFGNGQNFISNLSVMIAFENYAPYEIKLEDGYSPSIWWLCFGENENLLFCSSQTGGSGGYGNYRVYRLNADSYQLLYDDKIDSESSTFTATFQPNGFMKIYDGLNDKTLEIYVGFMDKYFYDLIFAPDGSVKDEEAYVNYISFVSPSLNPASGKYRIITYRSVAAVAEVNRLGYIVQTLEFNGDEFIPLFSEFCITL